MKCSTLTKGEVAKIGTSKVRFEKLQSKTFIKDFTIGSTKGKNKKKCLPQNLRDVCETQDLRFIR